MEHPPSHDGRFNELNTLTSKLSSLDERGLVLSLASFAEDALSGLLQSFMLKNKSAEKLLSGFNAPFGTLSTKLSACHALGLIDDTQLADFEILRQLRNKFAHSWRDVSLTEKEMKDRIFQLSFPDNSWAYTPDPVSILNNTICFRLVEVQSAASRGARLTQTSSRLLVGLAGPPEDQIREATIMVEQLVSQYPDSQGHERRFLEHRVRQRIVQFQMAAANLEAVHRPAFSGLCIRLEKLTAS